MTHRRSLRFGILAVAVLLPLLGLLAVSSLRAPSASAHPLGNFTVNRYSRLELYSDVIRVRYVLDMAEIPTFQEMDTVDTNGDGETSAAESDAYAQHKAAQIAQGVQLSIDGELLALQTTDASLSFPRGQAGLKTLRLALWLEAPAPGGAGLAIDFRDENYSDRVGWKEMLVRPSGGIALAAGVPTQDLSGELTSYPGDLISSPLDVRRISFAYDPAAGVSAPALPGGAALSAPAAAPPRSGAGFASLIDTNNITVSVVLLALLAAFGFGAVHALEPGHGKTFVAAYFVGVKGTARQAMLLGLIIAATHTVGVMVIGLVTLFGSQWVLPERLYPWLSLASALMILALGLRLILSRGGLALARRLLLRLRPGAGGEHGHSHGHGHTHAAPAADGAPPWRSLLAIGLADGLTPSPSALVVLLAAVSLHRIGLGLLLIVAFSVGLAAVLTLVCLGLIFARRFLDWLSARGRQLRQRPLLGWAVAGLSAEGRLMTIVPLGGATALIAVGLLLTVRALSQPSLPLL